jgi:3-oxoacyl-[acyl-carrier-protein] synthase II
MKAYIKSAGIISPQGTHGDNGFPAEFRGEFAERLYCIEPDYQSIINPVQLRRMPRILKMGLAASQICIKNAKNIIPGAIIIGTGLGCLRSLEKFLDEVIDTNEQITSVLPFINSTHNAVAAQIAMLLKNNGYNVTYCHRGFSFESALADALLHIEENRVKNILVGGIDEVTDDFIKLHGYKGFWKKPLNTLEMISSGTSGTIAGEGAAFFMISGNSTGESKVTLEGVHTFFNPDGFGPDEIHAEADLFLKSYGTGRNEIDAVILGINGDSDFDFIYYELIKNYFKEEMQFAFYKHLCGEYYTSTSFALWLAKTILETQSVPDIIRVSPGHQKPINKILIYNHFRNLEHSFILVGLD